MAALEALGGETWFRLGDGDLATHVERTRRLKAGESLSAITDDFRRRLGIAARLLPMSDDQVRTRLRTDEGWLDFQDYFVRLRCEPVVSRTRLCRRRDGPRRIRIFSRRSPTRRSARRRDLPVEPVHQHRPDPRRARRARRAARLPRAGRRGVADHRRPGGQGPDRQDDGRARPAGRRRDRRRGTTAISSTSTSPTRPMRAAVADLDIPVVLTRTLMQSLEDREALARTVLAAAERVRQVTDAADIWAVVPVKDTAAREAAARAGAARRSAAGAGAGDARRRAGGARRGARPRRPRAGHDRPGGARSGGPLRRAHVSTTALATAIPGRSRRRRGVSPPRGAAAC